MKVQHKASFQSYKAPLACSAERSYFFQSVYPYVGLQRFVKPSFDHTEAQTFSVRGSNTIGSDVIVLGKESHQRWTYIQISDRFIGITVDQTRLPDLSIVVF